MLIRLPNLKGDHKFFPFLMRVRFAYPRIFALHETTSMSGVFHNLEFLKNFTLKSLVIFQIMEW
jgi:hypothetical protein